VAAGGALGSVLRVLVGWWAVALLGAAFPWGTLAVNLSGSLALGFLDARLPPARNAPWRAFAIPGFCGGFTTFSAFGVETVFLLEAGRGGSAVAYVVVSALLCLVGVLAGGALGRGRPGQGSIG
jgi:CrcB protein